MMVGQTRLKPPRPPGAATTNSLVSQPVSVRVEENYEGFTRIDPDPLVCDDAKVLIAYQLRFIVVVARKGAVESNLEITIAD